MCLPSDSTGVKVNVCPPTSMLSCNAITVPSLRVTSLIVCLNVCSTTLEICSFGMHNELKSIDGTLVVSLPHTRLWRESADAVNFLPQQSHVFNFFLCFSFSCRFKLSLRLHLNVQTLHLNCIFDFRYFHTENINTSDIWQLQYYLLTLNLNLILTLHSTN